jgi:hypothetical protein
MPEEYYKKCGREILSGSQRNKITKTDDSNTIYHGKEWCLCNIVNTQEVEKMLIKLNKQIKKVDLLWRADGRLEWLCEHRVGHTVFATQLNFSHGCDGCCKEIHKLIKYIQNGNTVTKSAIE